MNDMVYETATAKLKANHNMKLSRKRILSVNLENHGSHLGTCAWMAPSSSPLRIKKGLAHMKTMLGSHPGPRFDPGLAHMKSFPWFPFSAPSGPSYPCLSGIITPSAYVEDFDISDMYWLRPPYSPHRTSQSSSDVCRKMKNSNFKITQHGQVRYI